MQRTCLGFKERDLNVYYFPRSPRPRILATFIAGFCGAWIFFYSVQMNFVIGTDCYASKNAEGVWISTSNSPPASLGQTDILNISYRNRLLCVLGVTIWSQIAFVGLIQICKPLRMLTMIIGVYTIGCYIAWVIGYTRMVMGPATKICTPTLDTTSYLGTVSYPFF